MWFIVQHRLTGTVLGVVRKDSPGWESVGPGERVTLGTRAYRVRSRCTQDGREPELVFVEGLNDAPDAPDSAFLGSGDEPAATLAALPFLEELGRVIEARKHSTAIKSYTRSLLDDGTGKIGDKLREEADELARALTNESDERVANEAADVIFHLLVGLSARDLPLAAVVGVLARRFGVSGHVEKASRAPAPRRRDTSDSDA